MPFQVSPGVNVTEIDLTTIVPAVSTTEGAIAGVFRWGPADERVLISSEDELVARFGRPTSNNHETFFTAANFLAYGNKLYVVRSQAANTYNAVAAVNSSITFANTTVKNVDNYDAQLGTFNSNVYWVAKYGGYLGNSLKISTCESTNAFSAALQGNSTATANMTFATNSNKLQIQVTASSNSIANTMAASIIANLNLGDYVAAGNSSLGTQYLKVTSIGTQADSGNSTVFTSNVDITLGSTYNLAANVSSNSVTRYWEYFSFVDGAPGTSIYTSNLGGSGDEMHVVVADEDGAFTGVPGQVLEVWSRVSRATDARTEQGGSNYFRNVMNNNSQFVWWANNRSGLTTDIAANMTAITLGPYTQSFRSGYDGVTENTQTLQNLSNSYNKFSKAESVDISLILTGKSLFGVNGEGLANWLIDNIAEVRKDCIVCVSPQYEDVVQAGGDESTNIVTFRNSLRSTSYAVLDSGYKYQYDKYNDVYRWIPFNGDVAGTIVRTDDTRDPWFSPAGFNRGQIKNVVKMAYNPDKANRDILYKAGCNPIVNFPGEGVILYGDKTLLAKPSAFDRINVRRLFIVLEKAIATSAKFTLFEFNDEFTRSTFRNLVEPYLRDIKGRRGIYDFKVVCDGTNNTPERIDRNEFWGDIYVKPARSINFIQLNFVAVRTGVEFDEIVGKF
ncbi:tail sheath protein [uncultured Caudovirales phage]|uniref:Tail sheath protein n=1 Tax=uncultured Caudovirales phage TaxID=2100421 RepID=A0A6J7WZ24_9CAUD|nr:tail sheath protein [uncultured Caudovirales phage]